MNLALPRERFRLRPVGHEDAERLFAWRDKPRVREGMYNAEPLDWRAHQRWLDAVLSRPEESSFYVLEGPEAALGLVGFTGLSHPHGRAEWTIYVGEDDAPRGSGMALGFLGLEKAFGPLGVRKLCTEVLARNPRSVEFHHRLLLRHEGVLRGHVIRSGVAEDVEIFGLTREEWPERRQMLARSVFAT